MNPMFFGLILAILLPTSIFADINLNTETVTAFRSRDFSRAERLAQQAWVRFETSPSKANSAS